MRILFCDDDDNLRATLQGYVAAYFDGIGGVQPEYGSYHSGEALLEKETVADIAFLDVEMAGISGIHVGRKLKENNPRIKIFIVTSYPDYLDEAMRFQVFRYLSKPIDKGRLYANLKDAMYQYNLDTKEYPILSDDRIVIKRAEEIVCVEASKRRCLIYTTDEVLPSAQTMEYWRNTLDLPCFYSPHKSYIVNMRFVSQVNRDSVRLRYAGQELDAYLAKRKYTHFKDTFLLYLESVQ